MDNEKQQSSPDPPSDKWNEFPALQNMIEKMEELHDLEEKWK